MNTKRMLAVLAIIAMVFGAFAVIVPCEDIVASDGDSVDIRGDFTSKIEYTDKQTVVVTDDLNIINGGSITIKGNLIVNEGVTVTIEDGLLLLMGDALINGTIISQCGDYVIPTTPGDGMDAAKGLMIAPISYKEVVINGEIIATGNNAGEPSSYQKSLLMSVSSYNANEYPFDSSVTGAVTKNKITVNGSITVGTSTIAYLTSLEFEKDSKFFDYGCTTGPSGMSYLTLNGYMYFDGMADSSIDIKAQDPAAVIEVRSIAGSITINDFNMPLYTYCEDTYRIGALDEGTVRCALAYDDVNETFYDILMKPLYDAADVIDLVDLENVKVTFSVKTGTAYDELESKNKMYSESAIAVSSLDAGKNVGALSPQAKINVNSGDAVFESMTVDGISIIIEPSSEATVTGEVTILSAGEITVRSNSESYSLNNGV